MRLPFLIKLLSDSDTLCHIDTLIGVTYRQVNIFCETIIKPTINLTKYLFVHSLRNYMKQLNSYLNIKALLDIQA